MSRPWAGAVVVIALAATAAADDDTRLELTDLSAYRAALEKPAEGPTHRVTFRELWDDPGRYQGKRVRVEGKVARRFSQGAVGTFPALVELWAVSPAGDPFCLVYPSVPGSEAAPGASVAFEGTYLKRLRYKGADADRLAPLVVGAAPPTVTAPAPKGETGGERPPDPLGRLEWTFGLVAAGLVALVLARGQVRGWGRRPKRGGRDDGPPPEFNDGV